MATKTVKLDKGGLAEEALAEYFRTLGSFVIRGVPVREAGEDVTDIDLWVYTRTSAHARHIAIVDIKNKRRGKAFERAVWVKGLQAAVRADEVIIASQGSKDSVYTFAARLNVRVISNSVFDAIVSRYSQNAQRLAYESLQDQWKDVTVASGNLKARMEVVRSEISKGISFPSLNHWIDEAATYLKLAVERERTPGPLIRAAYLCGALVAIGADYLGKEHSLSDSGMRRDYFRQGLLFGRTDPGTSKSYLDFAENVVTEFYDQTGAAAARIRAGFENAVKNMPIEGLVELFSKPNAGAELFKGAVALEAACFTETVAAPRSLVSLEAKAIIGLISDYAGLRRKDVLGIAADSQPSSKIEGKGPDNKEGLLL